MNSSTTPSLARLVAIDPREVWHDEAQDFTPWLARDENMKLLGDTLGIELAVEDTEKKVGPFRADIVCKNTGDDSWVLIENQLEKTDHAHLGQLLTYGAGLHAVTIVWIARKITNEHRGALDWLNEITNDRHNFFGLEIELYQIDDDESRRAPKFNVASKPNDWTKEATPSPTLTEGKALQVSFWNAFREHVSDKGARFKVTKAQPHYWMNLAIGRAGFTLVAIASTYNQHKETSDVGELRTEIRNNAGTKWDELLAQRALIETELGDLAKNLIWENPKDLKRWRVYLRKTADVRSRDKWAVQHEWLRQQLNILHEVFQPIIKEL